MQQIEQPIEPVAEPQPWETPELVKSDVASATQFIPGPNNDGVLGS